jgi:glycosyltransferase involved in cell wall biosynthesis
MFSMQKFGGITRYFSDLIVNLPERYEYDLPISYSENHHLAETGCFETKFLSGHLPFRIKRRFYYFLNDRLSKKRISQGDFDIFHPTYYDDYYVKHLRKPFILTIHDMMHEKFRDTFPFYDRTCEKKRRLAEQATHIIAVSQNTKNDLMEIYDIDPNKISVVYHGYHQRHEPAGQLFDNYILYVGERNRYKNFYFFVEALVPVLQKYPEIKIVCTGKMFNKKEQKMFISRSIEKKIVHISASDAELASLYKYALMFVYPSLYEGFGIPILEAFRNDCPVCLSYASCFPEIAENAACYFDPLNKDSIQNTVLKLLFDRKYADKLIAAGKERLKKFSIEKMINDTCNVYDKVL